MVLTHFYIRCIFCTSTDNLLAARLNSSKTLLFLNVQNVTISLQGILERNIPITAGHILVRVPILVLDFFVYFVRKESSR